MCHPDPPTPHLLSTPPLSPQPPSDSSSSFPFVSVILQIRVIHLLAAPKSDRDGRPLGRGKRGWVGTRGLFQTQSRQVCAACRAEPLLCQHSCHIFVSNIQTLTLSKCSVHADCACAECPLLSGPYTSPPFPTHSVPRSLTAKGPSGSSLALWLLLGFSQWTLQPEVRSGWGSLFPLSSLLDHGLAVAFLYQRPQLLSHYPLLQLTSDTLSWRPHHHPVLSPGMLFSSYLVHHLEIVLLWSCPHHAVPPCSCLFPAMTGSNMSSFSLSYLLVGGRNTSGNKATKNPFPHRAGMEQDRQEANKQKRYHVGM